MADDRLFSADLGEGIIGWIYTTTENMNVNIGPAPLSASMSRSRASRCRTTLIWPLPRVAVLTADTTQQLRRSNYRVLQVVLTRDRSVPLPADITTSSRTLG